MSSITIACLSGACIVFLQLPLLSMIILYQKYIPVYEKTASCHYPELATGLDLASQIHIPLPVFFKSVLRFPFLTGCKLFIIIKTHDGGLFYSHQCWEWNYIRTMSCEVFVYRLYAVISTVFSKRRHYEGVTDVLCGLQWIEMDVIYDGQPLQCKKKKGFNANFDGNKQS